MASRFPTRYMALLVAGILVCINMAYLYTSQRSPFRYKARSKYTGSKQNASFTGGMYDVVLAFGDSTTQFGDYPSTSGWLTHLSRFYERRMDVLNRGFSGYTTIDARNVVELVLPETASSSSQNRTKSRRSIWPPRDDTLPTKAPTVRLLILFFGANDSVLEGYDKHVPLAAFSENLRYIASLIRDPKSRFYAPETRILFVTPPTVGDKMYGYYAGKYGLPVKRKNKVTRLYAEAVKAVAKTVDAPCIDLWSAIETRVGKLQAKDPLNAASRDGSIKDLDRVYKTMLNPSGLYDGYDRYLIDGIHLNANGNELLARLVMATIKDTWPDLDPGKE